MQTAAMKSSLRLRRSLGYSSTKAVMKPSTVQNFKGGRRSAKCGRPQSRPTQGLTLWGKTKGVWHSRDGRAREVPGSRPDSASASLCDLRRVPSLWISVSRDGKCGRWLCCSTLKSHVEQSRGSETSGHLPVGPRQWPMASSPCLFPDQQGWVGAPPGAREGVLTWLSMPSISSIEKKRMAQRGEMGSWVTASGYARNANPGPVEERIKKKPKKKGRKVLSTYSIPAHPPLSKLYCISSSE